MTEVLLFVGPVVEVEEAEEGYSEEEFDVSTETQDSDKVGHLEHIIISVDSIQKGGF